MSLRNTIPEKDSNSTEKNKNWQIESLPSPPRKSKINRVKSPSAEQKKPHQLYTKHDINICHRWETPK